MDENEVAFGPVPSRRLGASLGINNIPPKKCSYSCVYCQLGRTSSFRIERKEFYEPEAIYRNVEQKVREARVRGEPMDYLTFVSDGEPTLDINLGREIGLLENLGIKIAVITNASLLGMSDVRVDLEQADWVSVKIDSVSNDTWKKMNRPHRSLLLHEVLQGISDFSGSFTGELVTETMLVKNVNDEPEELENIADFIAGLKTSKSYLSIPIRPPAESWVGTVSESTVNSAYQVFSDRGLDVEFLIGYEGNAFASTGNIEDDILSITAVHPMREEGVNELLNKTNGNWSVIENLIRSGKLVEKIYKEKKFYLRRLSS